MYVQRTTLILNSNSNHKIPFLIAERWTMNIVNIMLFGYRWRYSYYSYCIVIIITHFLRYVLHGLSGFGNVMRVIFLLF